MSTYTVEPVPLGSVDRGQVVLVADRAAQVARVVESERWRRQAQGPATAHPVVELRDASGAPICADAPDVIVHRVLPHPDQPTAPAGSRPPTTPALDAAVVGHHLAAASAAAQDQEGTA